MVDPKPKEGGGWLTRRSTLLIAGGVLTLLSDMPGSAGAFAWIMPVPFLVYLTLYRGAKNTAWLFLALVVGSILTLAKTLSPPIVFSVAFSILSGTVTAVRYLVVYVLWATVRRRSAVWVSVLAFPAIVVTMEFLQAYLTPLGVWGDLVNTQLYNLPLLQSASLFGGFAISALMAWAAVLVWAMVTDGGIRTHVRGATAFLVVFAAVMVFGDLRLGTVSAGRQVRTAAITSTYRFTGAFPAPDDPVVARTTDTLLARTRAAAGAGAELVVWGEGSTLVSQDGESAFLDRVSSLARDERIDIVPAYAALPGDGTGPAHPFRNTLTWVTADGAVAETYLKHHPIPGEGSVPGTDPLGTVSFGGARVAGAICYDYDFPAVSMGHAHLGADLVVLPGLDWRGMLRRHTLMARIRAIEGGFSILRPANGATSMAFDQYGRIRASMTDFGNNNKTMMASVPLHRVPTLYSRIGNAFAYAAILAVLFCFGTVFTRRSR